MRKFLFLFALLCSTASAFAIGGITALPFSDSYRWRKDDGGEAAATWTAAPNTGISMLATDAAAGNMRVRFSVRTDYSADPGTASFSGTLQYTTDPNTGVWTSVDAATTSNAFVLTTSPFVTTAQPTTQQISAGTYDAGMVVDQNNPNNLFNTSSDAASSHFSEFEYVLKATNAGVPGTYYFRVEGPINISANYARLELTAAVFNYSGSPYCGSTGTATPTNAYPGGGTYSAPAGLMIDAGTGAVDLAASTSGIYTVTYTHSGGQTATTQIAVRPQTSMPTGMNNAGNQSVCAGSNTDPAVFTSPIEGLTYNWTNSNPAIGIGASGTGDLPSFTTINGGTQVQYAQINVKPTGGTGCTFRNMAFRIAVNPVPVANTVADQFYCAGSAVPALSFTSATPGTYFAWTSSNAAIGLSQRKGTNTIPAFTASNTVGVTSTIAVTPIANHCVGTPMTFQVQTQNCTAGSTGTGDADARIALDRSVIAGPNPTTGVVRVQYSGTAQQLDVLVRDAYGTILMPVRRVASTNIQVDLSALRPGSYSIQFADPRTGTSIVRTIVKL